jgi:hypothetical protein
VLHSLGLNLFGSHFWITFYVWIAFGVLAFGWRHHHENPAVAAAVWMSVAAIVAFGEMGDLLMIASHFMVVLFTEVL